MSWFARLTRRSRDDRWHDLTPTDDLAVVKARHSRAASCDWMTASERLNDAILLCEAVIRDYERILGPDHTDTLRARNDLASIYGWARRYDEQITHREALVRDYERIYAADGDEGDKWILLMRHNLARAFSAASRTDEAITLYQALAKDYARLYGARHEYTLDVHTKLAELYERSDRADEAATVRELIRAGAPEPVDLQSYAELVRELITIGRTREFLSVNASGTGAVSDQRTVEIGRQLNADGGMEVMRAVHAAVADALRSIPGRGRELEAAWSGIGKWQG
ncbi:tetratricopeptide repeat protein [Nocardia sp. NPDC052112]|uniref:tetratricopeptide repeat protein n=1 Tax=Nocardia sp. NPDC052112 TaxID=3155646 RepID=UPI0034239AEC